MSFETLDNLLSEIMGPAGTPAKPAKPANSVQKPVNFSGISSISEGAAGSKKTQTDLHPSERVRCWKCRYFKLREPGTRGHICTVLRWPEALDQQKAGNPCPRFSAIH